MENSDSLRCRLLPQHNWPRFCAVFWWLFSSYGSKDRSCDNHYHLSEVV